MTEAEFDRLKGLQIDCNVRLRVNDDILCFFKSSDSVCKAFSQINEDVACKRDTYVADVISFDLRSFKRHEC